MFSVIKSYIKNNVRLTVFIVLIFFSFLSFNIKQIEDKQSVISLLTFLDNSFSYIDNTVKTLSTQTLILENKDEDFDKIITSLQDLSSKLNEFKFSIPNENGNEVYQDVRLNLLQVYTTVQDRVDLFSKIYQARKNIQEDSKLYALLTEPELINSNEKVKEIIPAWQNIISYKKIENTQYENPETKKFFEDKIKNEETILENIIQLNNNDSENLSESIKESFKSIANSTIITSYNGFLRLQIESIQTPTFGEKVSSLQESVKELKKEFNL